MRLQMSQLRGLVTQIASRCGLFLGPSKPKPRRQPLDAKSFVVVPVTDSRRVTWLQAATCLLCAIAGVLFTFPIGPTEFSGGWLTGPLLRIHEVSGWLFLVSAVLALFRPRPAAVAGLVAVVLALPLYLYFVTPGFFRLLFPGEHKVLATSFFATNPSAIGAVAMLIVAAYACARRLLRETFVLS